MPALRERVHAPPLAVLDQDHQPTPQQHQRADTVGQRHGPRTAAGQSDAQLPGQSGDPEPAQRLNGRDIRQLKRKTQQPDRFGTQGQDHAEHHQPPPLAARLQMAAQRIDAQQHAQKAQAEPDRQQRPRDMVCTDRCNQRQQAQQAASPAPLHQTTSPVLSAQDHRRSQRQQQVDQKSNERDVADIKRRKCHGAWGARRCWQNHETDQRYATLPSKKSLMNKICFNYPQMIYQSK